MGNLGTLWDGARGLGSAALTGLRDSRRDAIGRRMNPDAERPSPTDVIRTDQLEPLRERMDQMSDAARLDPPIRVTDHTQGREGLGAAAPGAQQGAPAGGGQRSAPLYDEQTLVDGVRLGLITPQEAMALNESGMLQEGSWSAVGNGMAMNSRSGEFRTIPGSDVHGLSKVPPPSLVDIERARKYLNEDLTGRDLQEVETYLHYLGTDLVTVMSDPGQSAAMRGLLQSYRQIREHADSRRVFKYDPPSIGEVQVLKNSMTYRATPDGYKKWQQEFANPLRQRLGGLPVAIAEGFTPLFEALMASGEARNAREAMEMVVRFGETHDWDPEAAGMMAVQVLQPTN
jgi:hypothetical protein